MHTLSAALFLLVATSSLIALYARVARSKTPLSRAHAAPIFAFVSLGVLAIVAAILGLTESNARAELLTVLIQFECEWHSHLILSYVRALISLAVEASAVYVFSAYIPSKIIARAKVHACNALVVLILLCGKPFVQSRPHLPRANAKSNHP